MSKLKLIAAGLALALLSPLQAQAQGDAGQRMIAIHGNRSVIDGCDRYGHPALRRLGLELHPGLNDIDTLECFTRHLLHHEFLMFAVTVFSRDFDIEFITGGFSDQRIFQARNDLTNTMKIGQRFVAL